MIQGAGDRGKGTAGQRGRALHTAGQRNQKRAGYLAFHKGAGGLVFAAGLWGRKLAEGEVPLAWLTWRLKWEDQWGERASTLRTGGTHALVRSELRSHLVPSGRKAARAGRRTGLVKGGTHEVLKRFLPHLRRLY